MEFSGEQLVRRGDDWSIRDPLSAEHFGRYAFARRQGIHGRVLDAACGTGYGTALLRPPAGLTIGLDLDPKSAAHARVHFSRPGVGYLRGNLIHLPFHDRTFDAVVSFETIEHLAEHGRLLDEFRRVLNDDGTLILSTPDRPTYRRICYPDGGANPFHIAELTTDEFRDLLRPRFRSVALYGQIGPSADPADVHRPSILRPLVNRLNRIHPRLQQAVNLLLFPLLWRTYWPDRLRSVATPFVYNLAVCRNPRR